jgi:hypothetical protein
MYTTSPPRVNWRAAWLGVAGLSSIDARGGVQIAFVK